MPVLKSKIQLVKKQFNPNTIPDELKQLPQWCVWRSEPNKKGGNPKKMPYSVKGGPASSTDPKTWSRFEDALELYRSGDWSGLMFAVTEGDPYVFVDIDHCRNTKNKTLKKDAQKVLDGLQSYSEVSVSGTGIHVLVKAQKPDDKCRQGGFECYSQKRFAALTGRVLKNYPPSIEDRQQELNDFYKERISISQSDTNRAVSAVPVPEEKLQRILENRKAVAIYKGDHTKYGSQSEADLALCNIAVKEGLTESECRTLIETARENSGASSKHDGYFRITYQRANGDITPVPLAEARVTFNRWMLFDDATGLENYGLEIVLAVVASSHLSGDPLWLHVVGPPSTGKTETINAVDPWPTVFPLTELTPAGLVSGINTDDGKNHSLLPLLNFKTLAIKDFTPTIDAPRDQRAKLFGRLRDAFDGSQTIHTAMVGTRTHRATFNCLTCVTGAIEKLWRNTSLGERYLLYRQPIPDPMKSALRAMSGVSEKKRMREELRKAACGVLASVDLDAVPRCSEALQQRIARLATMLARARTYVERSRDHELLNVPESEGTTRIVQQLFKLAQGLALIDGRDQIIEGDLTILARVALDSMPLIRRKLIDVLMQCPRSRRTYTKRFKETLGMSQSVIQQRLDELVMLGICDKKKVTKGNRMTYRMTNEFFGLMPQAAR